MCFASRRIHTAKCLLRANQNQQARDLLEKRVRVRDNIPVIHWDLASTYAKLDLTVGVNRTARLAEKLSQRYRAVLI